ncbi:hypothetical protein KP509_1Z145600 [Ceratopteris richardii]|nr:hypothetical protein KP509_1Z145600 [Ceratopteris richardii]
MGSCYSSAVERENRTLENPSTSLKERGKTSRRCNDVASDPDGDQLRHSRSNNLKVFSFNDLKSATRNFRPDSVLGKGGFGCVFKGWIDEQGYKPTRPGTGLVIAVKKLNQEGLQGHKEWLVDSCCLSKDVKSMVELIK